MRCPRLLMLPLALWLLLAAGCTWPAKSINGQGVALYHSGNLDAAQASFQQAMSRDPQNPHVYYNLARVLHQKGIQNDDPDAMEQAESYYNLCLDRAPDHQDCYRSLAVLLMETGRTEQAFTLLDRWSQRSPHLAAPKFEVARLYEEHQDLDTAKNKLLEALTVEPNNARALAALGHIREQQGETAQAMIDYQRSLWQNNNQPEVAARLAALRAAGGAAPIDFRALAPTPIRSGNRKLPTFR